MDASPQSPDTPLSPASISSPISKKASRGTRGVRVGLRSVLVTLLLVAAVLFISGAVVNERFIRQFFGDQPEENVYFGVPETTGLRSVVDNVKQEAIPRTTSETISSSRTEEEKNEKNKKDHGEKSEKDKVETGPGPSGANKATKENTIEQEEGAEINDQEENTVAATTSINQTTFLTRPWLPSRNGPNATSTSNRTIVAFEKQHGVVIATKIHGDHQLHILEQSLCLLHFAYNRRPLYDIVVFTTTPVSDESIAPIQQVVHPAKITFVVDNRGLQEEIAALSKNRYDNFLKACGVTSPINLTWWSECPGRIAYNWQAEFRTWHIWRHPALKDYSTMLWLDSDAFCTMEWPVDPIQTMLENDLVVLFDNWPKGRHRGKDVQARIWEAFQLDLCQIRIRNGHFQTIVRNTTCGGTGAVADIHGFFHITNLDFYRSDPVQKWAKSWIGDGFLQRRYDDQAGITVPAAILAPERSWHMRKNNITLAVFHNFDLDGSKRSRVAGFKKYWKSTVVHQLPDAVGVCEIRAGA